MNEWTVDMLLLTIGGIEVIDIGITEGTAGHSVAANTNARGSQVSRSHKNDKTSATNLATGPIMLKISNNIASVTVRSSSPT